MAPCLRVIKFRSRQPWLSTKSDRITRNSEIWATVIRDFGPALQLFRVEPERLELPAPFDRWITEPLDADAAGQTAFDGCLDQIGC